MISVPRPKRYYSRRALLKGLGLGMGVIPLLNSERIRAQTAGVAKRFISVMWGSGVCPPYFYPPAGALGTLPATLAPFEAWKSKMLVVRGKGTQNSNMGGIDYRSMVATNAFGGHSSFPCALTGTATGTSPSIDTLIAADLGTAFPKAQLNVGARPGSTTTSWRANKVKNTPVVNPYTLFSTLFAGTAITPAQRDTLLLRRTSVLDHVITELTNFQNRIGTDDKAKVGAHLDSIRTIEKQLAGGPGATTGAGCAAPILTPTGLNFTSGVTNFPTQVKMTMDLIAAAVKCDMARAITIDLNDNGGTTNFTFPWLTPPVTSPDFHGIAHLGAAGGTYPQKQLIDTWYFTQVAYLAAQLGSNPEGGATTLDNTVLLVLNDMSEGSFHDVRNIPCLILGSGGGFFKQGTCVQLAANAPNNQLLTSVLHAMGMTTVTGVGDPAYPGDLDAVLKA